MEIVKRDHDYRPNYEQVRGLIELIRDLPLWTRDHPMIEIGSNTGDSTEIFSLFFRNITCVDCWENDKHMSRDGEDVFSRFREKVGWRGINAIRCTSDEVVSIADFRLQLPPYASFIYIDANHSYPYVKRDIANFWDYVCDGGVIGGHDYGLPIPGADGVERAVNEAFGEPDRLYEDGSWVVTKTKARKIN